MDGASTGDVLEVEDLFFRLGQGVRLEAPDGLQVIAQIARISHQARRIDVVYALPPEFEEQQSIRQTGQLFFHPGLQ